MKLIMRMSLPDARPEDTMQSKSVHHESKKNKG